MAEGKPGQGHSFEGGIDFVSTTQVLNSCGREALRPKRRAVLTAAFTGGALTVARLHSWGLAASPLCPWCGKPGTLVHRLLENACGDDQLKQIRRELKLVRLISKAGGSTGEGGNPCC